MEHHARLRNKYENLRGRLRESDDTRLRRSLSWLERAESAPADEPDERFLFYWIAFAAAYVVRRDGEGQNDTEFALSTTFLRRIASADGRGLLERQLDYMEDSVRLLVSNPYVYDPFWSNRGNWKIRFAKDNKELRNVLQRRQAERCIYLVLKRLHVLRNQIVHGGTTLRSDQNRKQIKDGAKVMRHLVPAILEIMLDHLAAHPKGTWGVVPFPRMGGRTSP